VATVIEFVLTVLAMFVGLVLFGGSSAALLQGVFGITVEPVVWLIAFGGAWWLAHITRKTVRRRLGLDEPGDESAGDRPSAG
jgi:hypothetical protein